MAYLNWREAPNTGETSLRVELGGHPVLQHQIGLALSPGALRSFSSALDELFNGSDPGELRVVLPGQWLMFWKRREGESRLLLAHPQKDEWVATLALELGHGQALVRELQKLGVSGPPATLSALALGPLSAMSNVEVVLHAANDPSAAVLFPS